MSNHQTCPRCIPGPLDCEITSYQCSTCFHFWDHYVKYVHVYHNDDDEDDGDLNEYDENDHWQPWENDFSSDE
jgi:hypothetical protein